VIQKQVSLNRLQFRNKDCNSTKATMIDLKDIESLVAGQTLSLDERAVLGPAIEQLAAKERLSTCAFWGRILGQERDYLIVAGTTRVLDGTGASGILHKKLFYW
jgi:hypothetical protein